MYVKARPSSNVAVESVSAWRRCVTHRETAGTRQMNLSKSVVSRVLFNSPTKSQKCSDWDVYQVSSTAAQRRKPHHRVEKMIGPVKAKLLAYIVCGLNE